MRNILYYTALLLLSTNLAFAEDWQSEISKLREDVQVLQRQAYRGALNDNKSASSQNSEVQVKIGEYDEQLRTIKGRLDELDHKIKQNNDKLDKLNRDLEIRLKILEGRQIPDSLSAPAPKLPTVYSAPVATDAASIVVGDKIQGDDLAPIGGESETIAAPIDGEPQALVPIMADTPSKLPTAATPDEMYSNAMQAFNSGFYDEAEIAFEDIIKQHPDHKLAGNAQYWLGEIYSKQGDLNKAKLAFKKGYENYKNGNKSADSLYRLGMILESLKDNKSACIVFLSFADEFPKADANLKQKAQNKIKTLGCK